jgi:hypothetical protein
MASTNSPLVGRARRLRWSAVLAFAVLVVPALAIASHQFSDVPTSASFHDEVDKLVGAGITTGCGAGTYCPSNPVTRGQMAQFLARGLGSVAWGNGLIPISQADTTYVDQITIQAGPQPGGTAYVTVTGDLTLTDGFGTCPCLVEMWLEDTANTSMTSPSAWFVVSADAVQGFRAGSGSVTWTFEVPSGSEKTYGLAADVSLNPAPPAITGDSGADGGPGTQGFSEALLTGMMNAQYSPFGSPPD